VSFFFLFNFLKSIFVSASISASIDASILKNTPQCVPAEEKQCVFTLPPLHPAVTGHLPSGRGGYL